MIIHLTNIQSGKSFEVFLIQKSWFPSHQDESIAMRYLNAFTIEENNQFEINAVYRTNGIYITKNEISTVVQRLTEKHFQGPNKYSAFRFCHCALLKFKGYLVANQYYLSNSISGRVVVVLLFECAVLSYLFRQKTKSTPYKFISSLLVIFPKENKSSIM